ncbi:class I SAM-dependent DNA methyltransferase [Blastomonas aquatica]|uniref:Methyltransferase n=1 Tax=Blastomonas aquatica TaxID=1510276 RepID=A0ABQ1JGF9_9SPHN|nr:SAM-dependent methyltransferase [Blastomonas aquatica]GGB65784.1 methyltransferase [Blastomonas aquatica]
MRHQTSLDAKYFEQMFRDKPDPWGFETSAYEQAKYARTLEALGDRRFDRALEVGCANGVLTALLAPYCDRLLAIDISETALRLARERCSDLADVAFEQLAFPRQTPEEKSFDLLLLSEVVYYWDDGDLERAAEWIARTVVPGGKVLLVHWTGETDYPQSGDEAVEKLYAMLTDRIDLVRTDRQPEYRLDLWRISA